MPTSLARANTYEGCLYLELPSSGYGKCLLHYYCFNPDPNPDWFLYTVQLPQQANNPGASTTLSHPPWMSTSNIIILVNSYCKYSVELYTSAHLFSSYP